MSLMKNDEKPKASENTFNVIAGDLVLIRYSTDFGSGQCYKQGVVLGIGSFLKRGQTNYSIQLMSMKNQHRGSIVIVSKNDIEKSILSKQGHIPRVAINDVLSVKNNCTVTVKYIGKSLSMSLTEEIESKQKHQWRYESPKIHKNAETLYNKCDDDIYFAVEVLYDNNKNNNDDDDNDKGGYIKGIRYFYTPFENDKCMLLKASTLTKFCKTSQYELLIYGYLSHCSRRMSLYYLDIFVPIIQKFIDKSVGFTIVKLWSSTYSFGTCSVSTYKADYGVFDIDDNIYGPSIHVEFKSSYKRRGKSHSTLFEGLYKFESSGDGHVFIDIDEHRMSAIKSISITTYNINETKINVDNILKNIASRYNVDEKILLQELRKNNLKLHGINYNPITGLSKDFNCLEQKNRITYNNDALIAKIRERDKDKVVCFDGNGMVLMSNGLRKKICELNIGDEVMSFGNKTSMVECRILNIINKEIEMVELINEMDNSHCWITYEHPIIIEIKSGKGYNIDYNKIDGLNSLQSLNTNEINKYDLQWILPKNLYPYKYKLKYESNIYNFILNCNHTINVNGFWCCTLGHDYKGQIIEHELWGNKKHIKQYLQHHSQTYPDVMIHS